MAKTSKTTGKKTAPAIKAVSTKKVVDKKSKSIKKTPSTAASSMAKALPVKVVMKDLVPPKLATK